MPFPCKYDQKHVKTSKCYKKIKAKMSIMLISYFHHNKPSIAVKLEMNKILIRLNEAAFYNI